MQKVYAISSWLIILLGVGHTIMTPVFYHQLTLDALWFAGTGLALIFLGILNVFAIKTAITIINTVCICANLLVTIYFFLILLAFPKLEPQAIIGGIAILGLFISSIFYRLSVKDSRK